MKCVNTFLENKIYLKSDGVWKKLLDTWKPDTIYDISRVANSLEAENQGKFQELMSKRISNEANLGFKTKLALLYEPENGNAFNNFKTIISEIEELDPSKFNDNLWEVIFDDVKFNNYLKFSNKPQPVDNELLEILNLDSKATAYVERIKVLLTNFLKQLNLGENSVPISWCEDLVLFHKMAQLVLQYKEHHYAVIKWLNENAPRLLNVKKILEPDILSDTELIRNIKNKVIK
jgi:hypothetical protein